VGDVLEIITQAQQFFFIGFDGLFLPEDAIQDLPVFGEHTVDVPNHGVVHAFQ
jgi:hypothetical protein